jgi:hypothetical protein
MRIQAMLKASGAADLPPVEDTTDEPVDERAAERAEEDDR